MANVKTITATTTESTINFEATYQYMWFRNLGETDCYISEHSGIVANADNVTLLKAGEVARLTLPQSPAQSTAYIKAADGSNSVEVHAQNYSDCPFKISGKGGGQTITVEPLTVTDNGVYTAPTGKAYSPVTVDVQEQPWQPLQDGYSNFWFELTNDTLSPWLNFSAKTESAVIDWGDGSGEQILNTLHPTHTYSKAGKYVVKVKGALGITAMFLFPVTSENTAYVSVLKYVELNNDVTTLSGSCFDNCCGLIRIVGNVTTVGSSTFRYATLMEKYELTGIYILPNNLCSNALSLQEINLANVTEIGQSAFYVCRMLAKITIPSTVTTIKANAFAYSSSLSEIHVQSTVPPTLGTSVFQSIAPNFIIYVPVGTGDTYKSAEEWSTYADHILEEGQTPNRMMLAKFNSDTTDNEEMR